MASLYNVISHQALYSKSSTPLHCINNRTSSLYIIEISKGLLTKNPKNSNKRESTKKEG